MGVNSSLKLKSNNLLIGLLATHMEKNVIGKVKKILNGSNYMII